MLGGWNSSKKSVFGGLCATGCMSRVKSVLARLPASV